MKKKIIITLLVLLLLAGGGTAAVVLYHKHARSSNPAAVYPLDYFVGNWYDNPTSLSGFVQANEEQNIYAGTNQVISEVLVQLGDEVHIGDPLLIYDNEKLELHIDTMKAGLEVTEAELTMAKNELKRLRRITPVPDNATPQKTAAEIALEEAQEKLAAAEAELESAQFSEEAEKVNEINAEFSELVEQLMELEKPDPNHLPDADEETGEDDEEAGQEGEGTDDPGASEDDPSEDQPQEYEEQLEEYEKMRDEIIRELKEKRQELSAAKEAYQALNDRLYAAWEQADEACEKAREAYEKEQQGKGEEEIYTRSQLAAAIAAKEQEIKDGELSVKRQQLDIRLEEMKLKDGTVTASRDGVVSRLDISDENIGAGEPILTISGENSFTASINVDEWSYSHIEIGTEVSVLSYDTGMTYTGVVTEKGQSPTEDNYKSEGGSVSYYPITVAIRDGEGLYSGSWVEASIGSTFNEEERMNQLVLPTFLVKQEGGKYYVMKDEGGKLVKTYISTGKIYNGEMIVVKSGITASDRLAFPYLKNAVEGQATKPADINELYNELYK